MDNTSVKESTVRLCAKRDTVVRGNKSTSSWMIFTDDLYEIRSFTRSRRSGCRGEGEREGVGMVG